MLLIQQVSHPFPPNLQHCLSQTLRARELKFGENIHPHHVSHVTWCVSRVTCHISHVTCHISHVTCHVLNVMCNFFFFILFFFSFLQKRGANWCRVCYQWLPKLVFLFLTMVWNPKIYYLEWKKLYKLFDNVSIFQILSWDSYHTFDIPMS